MAEKKAWQKLDNESQKAFEAFEIYCQMDSIRSLLKTSRKLSKNLQTIKEWSVKYGWVERSTAFDDWKNDQRLQTLETKIEKSSAKEIDVWVSRRFDIRHSEFEDGRKLASIAKRSLDKIDDPQSAFFEKKTTTKRGDETTESTTLVPIINHLEKIARVLETAYKWQRNSCDMPTETLGHTLNLLSTTGQDYATLDADARRKLRERYEQEEREILEYCQREGIEIDF